jgi:aconitate hydratase
MEMMFYLKDIWPTQKEVTDCISNSFLREFFEKEYSNVGESNEEWNKIPLSGGELFEWNDKSTYIQEPPFFVDLPENSSPIKSINGARVLAKLGDSITTDHISPAGNIKKDTPGGKYLLSNGIEQKDFNSYGSRRGNDRIMTRGTFANVRLKNQLAPNTEGGYTKYHPTGEVEFIYDASVKYKESGTPLVILSGKEYGTGSSRDWAAKGTYLLGVKAVISESFERIHRANLVGMGVLPLQYKAGDTADSLGLTGDEFFDFDIDDSLKPRQLVNVTAKKADGTELKFQALCRIDTPVEVDYYRNGGILQTVLRNFLKESK